MRGVSCGVAPLLIVFLLSNAISGCGFIADKDRIVVATLDGEPIRRGDLATVIREMPDEVRPLIQTKGDLLRTLNKYIDDQIKAALVKELRGGGKIQADREVARRAYFEKHPEYRSVYQIVEPSALQMTTGDMAAIKAEIEFGIDDEEVLLLREEALLYKAREAFDSGAVSLSDQEISSGYQGLKDLLNRPEYVEFDAIQFPTLAPGAVEAATDVRRRLDRGESFEDMSAEFNKLHPGMVIQSAMENNPVSEKYRDFWDTITGCEVGQHFGPLYMPEREQLVPMENGQQGVQKIPAMYLVLKIVGHSDARPMTLSEAQSIIATSLLKAKVMRMLRDQHGVEIFADKLPRPEGYGNQYKDQMIDTSV